MAIVKILTKHFLLSSLILKGQEPTSNRRNPHDSGESRGQRFQKMKAKKALGASIAVAAFMVCSGAAFAATNLIKNGNFADGNQFFSSGYQYSPANMGPPQTYDLVFDAAQLTDDNAAFVYPTGQGRFLAVNGATVGGVTVWSQNVMLAADAQYGFSALVSSLFAASSAVLQFFYQRRSDRTELHGAWNDEQLDAIHLPVLLWGRRRGSGQDPRYESGVRRE